MRREALRRALERHPSLCLDDARDRGVLLAALEDELYRDADAAHVRVTFAGARTRGARVAVVAGMHGARLGEFLESVARLALADLAPPDFSDPTMEGW